MIFSDIHEYKRCLTPLYRHDPLLPRTLISLVEYKRLDGENYRCFTPEAVLGNIAYAFRKATYLDDSEVIEEDLDTCTDIYSIYKTNRVCARKKKHINALTMFNVSCIG
jgi:hypothetical protein